MNLERLHRLRDRITGETMAVWELRRKSDTEALFPSAKKVLPALAEVNGYIENERLLARLLARLQDENKYVRSAAAEILGRMGAAAATPEILRQLLARLRDKDRYVRSAAVKALSVLLEIKFRERRVFRHGLWRWQRWEVRSVWELAGLPEPAFRNGATGPTDRNM